MELENPSTEVDPEVSVICDEEKEQKEPSFECSRPYCRRTCCTVNIYWNALALSAVVVVYLLIGAALFSALERPNEVEQNTALMEANETYFTFLESVVDLLVNNSNGTISRREATVLVVALSEAAVKRSSSQVTNNWLYGQSLFFTVTVVTTIGYGTIAPVTTSGRALFIFYSFIGIPLTLILLAMLGNILNRLFNFCTRPLGKKMEKLWVRSLVLLAAGIVGLVLFTLIPSILFAVVNDWSYFTAIYFCFVTLTTVGFGDFVPSTPSEHEGLYRVCTGCWIFFGLAFVALIIAQVQEEMSKIGQRVREYKNRLKQKSMKFRDEKKLKSSSSEPD